MARKLRSGNIVEMEGLYPQIRKKRGKHPILKKVQKR